MMDLCIHGITSNTNCKECAAESERFWGRPEPMATTPTPEPAAPAFHNPELGQRVLEGAYDHEKSASQTPAATPGMDDLATARNLLYEVAEAIGCLPSGTKVDDDIDFSALHSKIHIFLAKTSPLRPQPPKGEAVSREVGK